MLHLSNFNGLLVEFCPSVCLTGRLVEQNAAKWRPVNLEAPAGLSRVQKSIVRVSERVLAMIDTLFVWARLCEKRNSQKVTKQGWLCSIEMKKGEHLCRSWHFGRCDGGRTILPKYFFQLLVRNSNCLIVLFSDQLQKTEIFWGLECKVMKQKDILGNGILKSKEVKRKDINNSQEKIAMTEGISKEF